MSLKKKIRTITAPKKTLKMKYNNLLQGKFPEIYDLIYQEFSINADTFIKREISINVQKRIKEEFLKKVKNFGITNINFSYNIPTKVNEISIFSSSNLISSKLDHFLLFRINNPINTNILRSVFYYLDEAQYLKKKKDFIENIIDKRINIETLLNSNNKDNIFQLIELISTFIDKSIIIYSNNLTNEAKSWYVTPNQEQHLGNKDIVILYVRINGKKLLVEPIIYIDLQTNTINNYIENVVDESSSQQNDYILSKKNLYNQVIIFTKTNYINTKKTEKNILKLDNLSRIYYNPYDKNEELPIIEIHINSEQKKRFLLGYPLKKFRNIYSEIDNELAGKVVLNTDINKLDVYWCNGYPEK